MSTLSDCSEDEYGDEEPTLINLDSFVSIITLHLPDSTIKDFVIDENRDDLISLRRQVPNQRTSRKRNSFNVIVPRIPILAFSVKEGEDTVEIPAEFEIYDFRTLVNKLDLSRFVKDGVLEIHLSSNDMSWQQWDTLTKQPNELLRDIVNVYSSDSEISRSLVALRKVDDELELILHSMFDDSEIRLRPEEIEDLYPTDEYSVKLELEGQRTLLLRFANQENVNSLITSIVLSKRKPSLSSDTPPALPINDSARFVIKKKNRYGFLQKRFCWLNSQEFTVNLTDLKMKNKSTYDLGMVAHFIKKGKNQRKVVLEFDPSIHKKALLLRFETSAELTDFMNLAESIINSKSASKLKAKRDLVFTQEILEGVANKTMRRYTWLASQQRSSASVPSILSYNCVQVNKFSKENRILEFDTYQSLLRLSTSDNKLLKTFQIDSLIVHHVPTDLHKLKLGGDGNIIVIFDSVYVKSHFCAVAHSLRYPELRLSRLEKTLKLSDVGVFVGTWNLGHQEYDTYGSLNKWLANLQGHSIIALGFQECKKSKRAWWINSINKLLEASGFSLLAFESMWEMFILVYIDKEIQSKASRVVKMAKATGIANMLGNKGGVLVSFSIEDTSYCFLSCHLAASPHKILARNQNMSDLLKLKPGHPDLELTQEFDYIFVLGDLNYRTDEDFFVAVDLLKQNKISQLLITDQLTKQRQLNYVMTQFREAEINFLPTYRISRETSEWSNKKNQTPSWTDRILYRAHRPIDVITYNSVVDALGSDHRPVFGSYVTHAVSWYLPEDLKSLQDVCSFALLEFKTLKVTLNVPQCSAKIAQMTFYAPFIEQNRGSIQVNLPCDSLEFSIQGDQMPMLSCIWNDFRFLREQRLTIALWFFEDSSVSEVVGVASLPLAPLLDFIEIQYPTRSSNFSCEATIPYSAILESQGVQVGNVEGLWTYNEIRKENEGEAS
mmetsp:Transcript_7721/g.14603  ORF Transcript_7721/g.14603 Transcript_7721/m.14603 type:complete len:949 (+) Transcript_7721:1533-4379(+)